MISDLMPFWVWALGMLVLMAVTGSRSRRRRRALTHRGHGCSRDSSRQFDQGEQGYVEASPAVGDFTSDIQRELDAEEVRQRPRRKPHEIWVCARCCCTVERYLMTRDGLCLDCWTKNRYG